MKNPEQLEQMPDVRVERFPEFATAYICINNGENNIMSLKVLEGLQGAINALKNDNEIHYVILHSGRIKDNSIVTSPSAECTGNFSTGANLREMLELSNEQEAAAYSETGQRIMHDIQNLDKITIVVIPEGYCVGGGLELSMSCKYRIANPKTKFQLPEKNLDIVPGWRGTQNLPYLIGADEATKWVDGGGKTLTAEKALELGLIDELSDNPLGDVNTRIQEGSPVFVSRAKHAAEKMSINGIKIENEGQERNLFAQAWKNDSKPKGMANRLEAMRRSKEAKNK